MTRGLSAKFITALESPSITMFYAVEGLFDGGAIRLWTGYGDLMIAGEVYTGAGHLLSVSQMEESQDLSAKGARIGLSGNLGSVLSLALQEPFQHRRVRIIFGLLDVTEVESPYAIGGNTPTLIYDRGAEVSGKRALSASDYRAGGVDPTLVYDRQNSFSGSDAEVPQTQRDVGEHYVEVFAGIADRMSIREDGGVTTIDLAVESKYIQLQRANTRRYTSANHKMRHPSDTFFDWVQSLQDKEFPWGRKTG